MKNNVLYWDVYNITTQNSPVHNVMLRGKIRKFSLQEKINLLTENASDTENTVRFALLHKEDPRSIKDFITSIVADVTIVRIAEKIQNPVLSKMKVNNENRYKI